MQARVREWHSAIARRLQSLQPSPGDSDIEIAEARELLKELPDVSPEDLARITRPKRILTLDQIDRITVLNVIGKNSDAALWQRS